MRKIVAVTTFHEAGYDKYASTMIDSFLKHWPEEVTLYAYWEGKEPTQKNDRLVNIDLLAANPDLVAFKERHKDNPRAHGKTMFDPNDKSRKPKGLGFQWDAVRFSHKSYCITHACLNTDADVVIFLDADTKTFADMSMDFLNKLHPFDTYCTFLGRDPKKYTETGFLGFNVKNPANTEFMNGWRGFYNDDTIFDLPVWHDCQAFDTVRRRMTAEGKIKENNISHNGEIFGHPFINSVLGDYMDHLKGNRKEVGYSRTKELSVKRNGEYWTKDKVLTGKKRIV